MAGSPEPQPVELRRAVTGPFDWSTAQLATSPILVGSAVMVLAAAESLIVVGSVVPGTTIILAAAAAAGAGGHSLWPMFAAAAVGAALGDGTSYWIGRRYGGRIARWGPLARRPGLLDRAERDVRRRGVSAIVVARFVPGVRTVIPSAAGALGMPAPRFAAASIFAAVLWAALHVFLPGVAGRVLSGIGGRLAAALVAAVLVIGLTGWSARLIVRAVGPWIVKGRAALHRRLGGRDDRASRLLARTLAPDDPAALLVLLWMGALLGALFLFGGLLEDVQEGDPIVQVDLGISRFVQTLRTPALDHAMVSITMLGDGVVLTCVTVAVLGWLLWRRAWWIGGAFAAASLMPTIFVPLVKWALGRARPLGELYAGVDAFSFPSGHAAGSATLLGLLAVLVAGQLRGALRWGAIAGPATLALAIGVSRVYLQAHWPSDVMAGFALGAAITAAFVLVLDRLPASVAGPAGIAAVSAGVALIAGGAHIAHDYRHAVVAYAPRHLSIEIAEPDWRAGGWRRVAAGRIGFEGELETRFLLQWVGAPEPLRRQLADRGWRPAQPWSVAALGGLLGPSTPLEAIPPIPQLHLGRFATEVWVRPAARSGSRFVFRLWPSRYTVDGETLSVEAIERERIEHPLGLTTLIDEGAAPRAAETELADLVRADPASARQALVVGDTGR